MRIVTVILLAMLLAGCASNPQHLAETINGNLKSLDQIKKIENKDFNCRIIEAEKIKQHYGKCVRNNNATMGRAKYIECPVYTGSLLSC